MLATRMPDTSSIPPLPRLDLLVERSERLRRSTA